MPPTDWTDRTIRGPEKEYLTAEEFRRLFGGLSVDTFRRLLQSGEIPGPVELSPGVKVFPWEHAVYYSLRCKMKPYIAAPGKGREG